MPQTKFSISAMGLEIQPAIEQFMITNMNAMNQTGVKPEDATKALSHAIAFGIAKAFASTSFKTALLAGVATPGGGPVGQLISTALLPTTIEI